LSGGAFDVSLVNYESDVFQVITTTGNTNLGGEDYDERVIEYFIQLFKNKTGKGIRQKRNVFEVFVVLYETKKRYIIRCKSLNPFQHKNGFVPQVVFFSVEEALKKFTKFTIDEVVLVGGSTRIPKIQPLVREYFTVKYHYVMVI
jgi:heat shock protein 5